jgi:two-component system cell cycle sensor histidine kinase/response regulator CckA
MAIPLEELPADHSLRELIEEICKAGDRAASLTRQLLTFSRRQVRSLNNFVLNDSVLDLEKMLRRLIGEDVELILSLDPDPAVIRNDRGHVEQILMNLAVNARDAMPKGGKLVIETSHAKVDELYAEVHFGLVQGNYAMLIVSDTGEGMPPEVKARIFEPFYTTKELGKGTGLGLSTVYGIVKQSEGAILVYSEPGKGTTFKILFPAVEASVDQAQPVTAPGDLRGTETILVVEDEEGLRKYVREVLEQRGYTVVTSTNGRDALDVARQFQGPIHLLLTDVVMPEMGGVDLGEDFAALRPEVPVLHMSGYTDRLWKSGTTPNFIQKPFTATALLTRIRRLLAPG